MDGWFKNPGVYTLFDGQFGSTGKGLLASYLATAFADRIDVFASNAGPNSGHVSYKDGQKITLQQLPTGAFYGGPNAHVYLCAGALIDPQILHGELLELRKHRPGVRVHVNGRAALIDVSEEPDASAQHVASTGKGTGPALARKVLRDRSATVASFADRLGTWVDAFQPDFDKDVVLMEIPQGFSLGYHGIFYPYVTSRECTPQQGLADLRAPIPSHRKSIVSLRTFPIRVGSTPEGHSGPVYPDQEELTWDQVGAAPEMTTVSNRVRRVFTWSEMQFRDMLLATRPDALFINFLNYLDEDEIGPFVTRVVGQYTKVMGRDPDFVLGGFGPETDDVVNMPIGGDWGP